MSDEISVALDGLLFFIGCELVFGSELEYLVVNSTLVLVVLYGGLQATR
jgi:hypothetical protein